MDRASKIKNALTMWLCALIVTLSLGETRAENFFATPSLELEQNQPQTQASTREITFAYGYDASDYAIAPKRGGDFFDGTKYTDKVKRQMKQGDNHAFPESVKGFQDSGKVSPLKGGDGVVRDKLEIPGSYKGKDGKFEFIKESDGSINHRFFNPNKRK